MLAHLAGDMWGVILASVGFFMAGVSVGLRWARAKALS